ncbi:unnamed protein product [Prorocentrum cordatum]|uniref:Uncharacterized protein n=1 Tax=Prorocentrum cordatum TaxID=2364126 RepID=A0ABN9X3N0_9DINO|nr:unnamed protein product [Polarella glacialis]
MPTIGVARSGSAAGRGRGRRRLPRRVGGPKDGAQIEGQGNDRSINFRSPARSCWIGAEPPGGASGAAPGAQGRPAPIREIRVDLRKVMCVCLLLLLVPLAEERGPKDEGP